MNDAIAKPAAEALNNQRRATKAFHRACVSEGHKNMRQAASLHLPMALLADFPLAIGIAIEMAAKLASPKERDRLRQLGRSELSTMGIEAIEEERVQIDVVLDVVPPPEDVRSLLALGLKRVRKDVGGRRFAGKASQTQVSALVTRVGGRLNVVEEADRLSESGVEERPGIAQTIDPSAAETTHAISEGSPTAIARDGRFDIEPADTPSVDDVATERSRFPIPGPRPAPRLLVPSRLGAFDVGRSSTNPTTLRTQERKVVFDGGARDDMTKPAAFE